MKKSLLILAAVFSYLMPIHATNNVAVNNVTIPQGGTGTISVALNNDKSYTAFSMKLTLPEGVTYTGVNKGTRMAEDHSVSGNGTTGVITCLSISNATFTGTSGTLFTITVSVSNEAVVGSSLGATLTEINFSTTSAEEPFDNVGFNIIVGEPSDGRVLLSETSTTAPEASSGAVDVRVSRTINAGEWSTICLPFAMTAEQVQTAFGSGVQLGDFTGYNPSYDNDDNLVSLSVSFSEATAIEANHPYIIKVSDAISEFTVDGVTIEPEDVPCVSFGFTTGKGKTAVYHPADFTGTYVADFDFYNDALSRAIFLSGNKFYYATANTRHMKAFRAYFDFDDVLAEAEENTSSRIALSFEEATDVKELKSSRIEGLKSYYDLKGQRVEAPVKKGFYIRDGKKVVIK